MPNTYINKLHFTLMKIVIKGKIREITFFSGFFEYYKWINVINSVVVLQFLSFSFILLYYIIIKGVVSTTLQKLNFKTLIEFVYLPQNLSMTNSTTIQVYGSNVSLENLSITVIVLTMLIIYSYFFKILGDNPYKSMKSESRSKYFSFFQSLTTVAFAFTIFILIISLFGYFGEFGIEIFLVILLTWINIFTTAPFGVNFYEMFTKYRNLEAFSALIKHATEDPVNLYKYRLNIGYIDLMSPLIYVLTIELAVYGYIININFLAILFLISTLLLTHHWISQLMYLPQEKCSILLMSGSVLNDVYILIELANDYIIVLSQEDKLSKIPLSNISQIFLQGSLKKIS